MKVCSSVPNNPKSVYLMKVPKYFKAQHQQVKCIKCYIPQNKAKISSGVTAKIDFFPLYSITASEVGWVYP